MTALHPRRTAATLAIAAAGLTLGHWAAYAIATPGAHAREQLLHATGHGYLAFATQVAVLAAGLGLVALFLGRYSLREGRGSFGSDTVVLAAVQSVTFFAMEVGERLASGASLHDLTHGGLLTIGLAVQISVAIAGAGALRLTDHAAEVAGALREVTPLREARSLAIIATVSFVAPRRPAMRSVASRAPPSLP
jgi:hypothetical protein